MTDEQKAKLIELGEACMAAEAEAKRLDAEVTAACERHEALEQAWADKNAEARRLHEQINALLSGKPS